MDTHFDTRPIGIFDSGVGGLTVLQALATQFPEESFLYLGDTARVPYGTKSARTVERYTIQVADFLLQRGVKALVAACNTASALGLPALRAHCRTPVLGVIHPGCRAALAALKSRPPSRQKVAVIGTHSTAVSGMYPHVLALLNPQVEVTSLACPLFVPLVEEGWTKHPAAKMIVQDSLQPLLDNPHPILILGCTHYPLLKPVIAEVLGTKTTLVDSANAVAEELQLLLGDVIHPAPLGNQQHLVYMVTDVADRFRSVAQRFLDDLPVEHVEMIDL